MNKTLTINISQIVFHIDENAFEALSKYLNTIKSYFNNNASRDEIITDIEARIAEIFSAKINASKQVITQTDVDEMIAIMGNPEVFKNAEEFDQNTNNTQSNTFNENTNKTKRIFRDPDDKVIGGVCSGIGAYFGIDPIWLRLAFAIAFFIFGTGFLFYLLLLVVIPKAKTTAEKLEMRGEKVNINNIEKKIKEEFDDIKKTFNNKDNEWVKATSTFFSKLVAVLEQLLHGIVRIFAVIIGYVFIVVGLIVLIVFLLGIFGNSAYISIDDLDVWTLNLSQSLDLFFANSIQLLLSKIALLLLIGIPLLMLMYRGIRILFKIKSKQIWIGRLSSVLWVTGLLTSIYLFAVMSNEFKQRSSVKDRINFGTSTINTVHLQLPDDFKWNLEKDEEDIDWDNYRLNGWIFRIKNEDGFSFLTPQIDIQKSNTDSFQLLLIRTAKGKTKKQALSRAESIIYNYTIEDSTIVFNPTFELKPEEKWRAQQVKIIIKVPIGKSVFIDKKMRPLIYDIDNVTNTYDGDMINHKWTMRSNGLTCDDFSFYKEKETNNQDEDF